jgi:thiamine transport system substrate-binding protein
MKARWTPIALLLLLLVSGCTQARATLTVLDQGSFPAFAKLKPLFENQTGAHVVQIDGGDAGAALQQALLAAGNPPADVLYGVDNALFFSQEVIDKRLYEAYESPQLRRINRTLIDVDQFRVHGALWTTPVDHGYISVNVDVRLKNASGGPAPPSTLRELATQRWAPHFVTEDPRASSPGLGFLLATIDTFGETGPYTWKDYWRDLLRNGTLVAHDWSAAYVLHYSGGYGASDKSNRADRSIVVSYTTSPAVEVLFGAPSPPGMSVEPPRGVFHQIETMGILRGSKHVDLARSWIDFCLTNAFQDLAAPELAVYPVVDGVRLPAEFHAYATDPSKFDPVHLRADQIGPHLGGWLDEWQRLYQERASGTG